MVRSLESRVKRLEEASSTDGECPECGGPDDFGPDDSYELVWVDPGGPEDKEEFCGECDRQLVYVITWGDEENLSNTNIC